MDHAEDGNDLVGGEVDPPEVSPVDKRSPAQSCPADSVSRPEHKKRVDLIAVGYRSGPGYRNYYSSVA